MLMRNIIWVLICAFIFSSCGRDYSTQRVGTSPPKPVIQNDAPAPISLTSFDGAYELKRDSSGVVSLLQGANLSQTVERYPHYQRLVENQSFGEMAIAFVQYFKIPFQLEEPKSELNVSRIQEDDLGFHQVRLAQNHKSVHVLNSEIIVHFDRDDHVYLVQGQYIRTPSKMDLKPKMTLNAVIKVITDHGDLAPLSANADPAILPLNNGPPKLVYQLKSQASLTKQYILLIDANNGTVIRKLPTIYNAD